MSVSSIPPSAELAVARRCAIMLGTVTNNGGVGGATREIRMYRDKLLVPIEDLIAKWRERGSMAKTDCADELEQCIKLIRGVL